MIDVVSLGPSADIESLDFGPSRELQHAEALVLVTVLGSVSAVRLASKLYAIPEAGEARDLRTLFQRILKNSKPIGKNSKALGAATIEVYLSTSISTRPLPALSSLTALKRSGKS